MCGALGIGLGMETRISHPEAYRTVGKKDIDQRITHVHMYAHVLMERTLRRREHGAP